jgi:predicted nucleotidyltransferase
MDNNLKIINYLGKNFDNGFTMHKLSNILDIPYASFYRTIQEMQDLIEIETVGKAKVIKLSKHPAVKPYLTISSVEEKKEYLQKNPIVKKITNELFDNSLKDIVLLFGSYASNKQTGNSDIDLLIINKDGKKTISFSKYEILFHKKINPIFITIKEFENMLKDKEENVGKQALKNHIVLNNPAEFWVDVF